MTQDVGNGGSLSSGSAPRVVTPIAVQHAPAPVPAPAPAAEKPRVTPKPSTPAASYADRPFVCPYEGCDKAYIHGYKLNLHLKTQHPEHGQEENANPKRSKHKVHSSKAYNNAKVSRAMPSDSSGVRNQWPGKATYQDDSEETKEDGGNNVEDGWRYGNNDDDEETPDED